MAFRRPKSWLLAASPRRAQRQPFRRATFPRDERASSPPAPRNAAAPPPAQAAPWWRALLDALAAPPARGAAGANARLDDDDTTPPTRRQHPRNAGDDGTPLGASAESLRPVTDRLDRHGEQLSGMNESLRRLVELQESRQDATAVYAPPA